jgi:hypothetical protein
MSTSNRRAAFSQPTTNPATKFFEWKSNEKTFAYYDKETKANVSVELPFKFLVLDELHTVKGWNDATESGIYSNEVKYISKDEMIVKPFKGNEIARGLYKDIKEKAKAAGGHYVKSIYIMLEGGEIANIQLKGAACQTWGDFTAKSKSRLVDEWVSVVGFDEAKKGSVKYTTPKFGYLCSLDGADADLADEAFNTLEAYLKSYLTKSEPVIAEIEVEVDVDDLEF